VRVFPSCGTRRARRKDRSQSANGKAIIEDQKAHTLEHNKGAPPELQNHSNVGPPANKDRKENMIDHVILTVSDFKRSVAFYAKALKPLGITALPDYDGKDGHPDLKGFGIGKSHFFWLKEGKPDPQAVHVGFVAKDHSEVDAFYKAALAAGGKSKASPQARLEYYPGYYATWVLDPDGHDIEVVNKS
jgi:catechol 2,3-dioxygenase-like lactoylglutathione lyase family enzyme